MFNNPRYAARGITEEIPVLTQIILWDILDKMPEPKDGFQVFKAAVYADVRAGTIRAQCSGGQNSGGSCRRQSKRQEGRQTSRR